MPAGTYSVTASLEGYSTKTSTAVIKDGQTTTLNFTLQPSTGTLTVSTYDSISQDPLPNVSLSLVGGSTYTGTSGVNATYTFTNVALGAYTLSGTCSNYTQNSKSVTIVSGNQTSSLYLTPNNTGLLSGNVINSSFENLQNVTVDLIFENQIIATKSTNAQGNYQFSAITPGSYILHAYSSSYQNSVTGVVLYDDQNTTANFTLNPNPITLTGVIRDTSSNLMNNATLSVYSANLLLFQTKSDVNGNYSVQGLSPGNYTIIASKDNYQSYSTSKTISSNPATQDIVIIANSGTLQGKISDRFTNPIAGAVVIINSKNAPQYTAQSDNNGNYTIKSLPEETYDVHVHQNGYLVAIDSVTISSLDQTKNFTLITSSHLVGGYVSNTSGSGSVAGAYVNLYYNGIFIQTAVTNSDGYYEFQGIPSGNYQIMTSLTGYFTTQSFFSLSSNQNLQLNVGLSTSAAPVNGSAVLSLNRYAMQTQKVYSLSWQTIPGIAIE